MSRGRYLPSESANGRRLPVPGHPAGPHPTANLSPRSPILQSSAVAERRNSARVRHSHPKEDCPRVSVSTHLGFPYLWPLCPGRRPSLYRVLHQFVYLGIAVEKLLTVLHPEFIHQFYNLKHLQSAPE